MMPSSTTRLVDAISKTIAAVKLAPLRNRARARATAAYEHDEEAAPKPGRDDQGAGAVVTEEPFDGRPPHHGLDDRGQDEAEDQGPEDLPRHRSRHGQGVTEGVQCSHRSSSGAATRQQLAQAVFEERMGERRGQRVVDDPALLAEGDEPRRPQHPQPVGDGVVGHLEGERQVPDAQPFHRRRGRTAAATARGRR